MRRGRRQGRYIRKRFANSVRSIVGWCFNHLRLNNQGLASVTAGTTPCAFISHTGTSFAQSYNDRFDRPFCTLTNLLSEWKQILESMMPQTAIDANAHVFVQGGLRNQIVFRNPQPYRQTVILEKWVLMKCEVGGAAFSTTLENNYGWFDQNAYRAGKDTTAVAAADCVDQSLLVGYTASAATAFSWNTYRENNTIDDRFCDPPPRLGFQCPALKRYVKIRRIRRVRLPPFSERTVHWTDPVPIGKGGEIKPRQVYDADTQPYFEGKSYWLFVKVRAHRAHYIQGKAANTTDMSHGFDITTNNSPGLGAFFGRWTTVAGYVDPAGAEGARSAQVYDVAAVPTGNTESYILCANVPVCVIARWTRSIGMRITGDSLPSYATNRKWITPYSSYVATSNVTTGAVSKAYVWTPSENQSGLRLNTRNVPGAPLYCYVQAAGAPTNPLQQAGGIGRVVS